jgi:NAD(P)-dependent dehydrogenase (short-subunit alcohol dehydrogenase family)
MACFEKGAILMAGELAGKVVMITGASGNLGSAAAERFGSAEAKLALVDRSKGGEAPPATGTRLTVSADVTDPASVDTAVQQIVAHFGQIDVLIHTVGGYAAGKPVHEAGIEVWEKMMTLNARSVYVTCGSVARHMIEKGVKGRIVVVLARAALKGTTNHAAYTASKAAAQRIIESMAAELLDKGITVNAVLPSTIDTPPNRQSMPNADFSKWVTPEQIADAMAFLASDSASAISGDSIQIYGRA